jgi:hypothetical protein
MMHAAGPLAAEICGSEHCFYAVVFGAWPAMV